MIDADQKLLIDMLIKSSALTEEELKDAVNLQELNGGSIIDTLLEKEYIRNIDIEMINRSQELGIPYMCLSDLEEDTKAASLVPASFALDRKAVPIALENNSLYVAMVDPLDVNLIDDLRLITESEIQPILSTEDDINDAIRRFYGMTADDIRGNLESASGIAAIEEIETIEDFGLDPDSLARTPTVIHYVDQLIIEAVREKATDIHIEPLEKKVRIRFRMDGVLHERPEPPKNVERAIISRVKIMARLNIAERRRPQMVVFKEGSLL